MRLRLDPQGFAQDDIGWSIGSMWGIPRAACRPALNDAVGRKDYVIILKFTVQFPSLTVILRERLSATVSIPYSEQLIILIKKFIFSHKTY